jgi:ketosteroid isomerase-like protein
MAPALANVKAEDEGVRSLILEALSIIRSDDFDRYFDLFTDDAVWMLPSSGKDVHMAQARTFYGFTAKFRFDQQCQVEELVVSEDWAFVRLTFDGYLRARFDESAPPLRSVSRHIWILRKEADDCWKISRDIWNNPRQSASR